MAGHDGTGHEGLVQAIWLDDPGFLRGLVERALQTLLEEEIAAHLGAERYERPAGPGTATGTSPAR